MTVTCRRTSSRRKSVSAAARLLLTLLALLARPAPAAEPLLSLQFDTLERAPLKLDQFSLQLAQGGDDHYQLDLEAAKVALPDGEVVENLQLQCRVTLSLAWLQCDQGRLALTHAVFGRSEAAVSFRYNFNTGLEQARLSALRLGQAQVDLRLDGRGPDRRIQATIDNAAVAELVDVLEIAGYKLPDAYRAALIGGRLDGRIETRGWPVTAVQADIGFDELNYSAESVAQAVAGRLQLDAERDADSWQNELQIELTNGELYIVPPLQGYETRPGFYIKVPATPITLQAAFAYIPDTGRLIIQDLDYTHPDVVRLNAAGQMQLTPDFDLQALSVAMPTTELARAYPVYLQPLLIDSAYNDVELSGRAALQIGLDKQSLNAFGIQLDNVAITDPGQRFAVNGLSTDLQLTRERHHRSSVDWEGIDIYELHFGAGAIQLASDNLDIRVTDWQDVALLDGRLNITELGLSGVGTSAFEMHMAGGVDGVSLPALTGALGWPRLGGTLDGSFSGLHYADGDLRMDGELLVRMFDGRVTIRDLLVRDLFGNLPVLAANIEVNDIDLERLTDTFSFGKITGRIGGQIEGLKLENWQPVAFDARLSTLDDGDTRHRISQKALNNLSQIGGGLSGALSRGFLRYFDEYSYGELGLSCRLVNGFCELGGVASYDGGHYLLTRGGLLPPWVEVKLAGSMIAWDVLIAGFERIAEGDIQIK